MGIAALTQHLGSRHIQRGIRRHIHAFLRVKGVKARPAGTGIKFGLRTEKSIAATNTIINPLFFPAVILAAEWRLGTLFADYLILLRREYPLPLSVAFNNFFQILFYLKVKAGDWD